MPRQKASPRVPVRERRAVALVLPANSSRSLVPVIAFAGERRPRMTSFSSYTTPVGYRDSGDFLTARNSLTEPTGLCLAARLAESVVDQRHRASKPQLSDTAGSLKSLSCLVGTLVTLGQMPRRRASFLGTAGADGCRTKPCFSMLTLASG